MKKTDSDIWCRESTIELPYSLKQEPDPTMYSTARTYDKGDVALVGNQIYICMKDWLCEKNRPGG